MHVGLRFYAAVHECMRACVRLQGGVWHSMAHPAAGDLPCLPLTLARALQLGGAISSLTDSVI